MNIRQLPGSAAVACGGALLFAIQPIVAKTLLPAFGGSAGVWVTCMMFFQVVLLLGYLYAFCLTRYLGPALGIVLHLALLGASLAVLPVRPPAGLASVHPTLGVLAALAVFGGAAVFRARHHQLPGAILVRRPARGRTPVLAVRGLERGVPAGAAGLSAGHRAARPPWACSCAGGPPAYRRWCCWWRWCALQSRAWTAKTGRGRVPARSPAACPPSTGPWLWIVLAACPSALWLAVANYLSQEVAAIPFLWVLPLSLYLLSFVLCFGWEGCYRPVLFRWLLPAAWMAIGWRIGWVSTARDLRLDIPAMLLALFVLCLFCHGELARHKPVVRRGPAFFLSHDRRRRRGWEGSLWAWSRPPCFPAIWNCRSRWSAPSFWRWSRFME